MNQESHPSELWVLNILSRIKNMSQKESLNLKPFDR